MGTTCTAVETGDGGVQLETNGELVAVTLVNATTQNHTELAEMAMNNWENSPLDRETFEYDISRLQVGVTLSDETSRIYIVAAVC